MSIFVGSIFVGSTRNEHFGAGVGQSTSVVCTESPLRAVKEDYDKRYRELLDKKQEYIAKRDDLLTKKPLPKQAIEAMERKIQDSDKSLKEWECKALPFVKAVEQGGPNAGEMKRRYFETFHRGKEPGKPAAAKNDKRFGLYTKRADSWCPKCHVSRCIDEGNNSYVCPNCAVTVDYLDNDTKNVGFGKHCQFTKPLGYEHVNHFRKLLKHMQADESTVVPREVINELRNEFRIKGTDRLDINKINKKTIRIMLRKTGHSDLYPNIPQIEYILTGRPPLKLDEARIRILIRMFHRHRAGFEEYKRRKRRLNQNLPEALRKKGTRKNLLYYAFLTEKFAEARGWEDIRQHVSHLKSVECLHNHDAVHREVCRIIDMKYTETPVINHRMFQSLLDTEGTETKNSIDTQDLMEE